MVRNFMIEKVYQNLVFFIVAIFLFRQVLPVNDLFWFCIIISVVFSLYIVISRYKSIDLKKIKSIIIESKLVISFVALYIIVDIINVVESGNYANSLEKYVILAQGVYIFLCVILIHLISDMDYNTILNKIYKCIAISGFVIGLIVIINYCIPFVQTTYITQISIIDDYNAFCRFFIFAYMVSAIYIYKKGIQTWKKILYILIYSIIVYNIVLLATSRRSLISLVALTIIIFLYFIGKEIKNSIKTHKWSYATYTMTIVICLIFSIYFITNFTSGQFVSYNHNHYSYKISRLETSEGRDTFIEITKDIVKEDILNKAIFNSGSDENSIEDNTVTVIDRMENDESDFFGKRSIIWNEAIKELKEYNIKELLIGKGAGYSSEMYNREPHRTVIKELYDKESNIIMHPHNYLLQDFLDGGVIKLIVSLLSTLGIGIYVFIKTLKDDRWLIPLLSLLLIASNIMISYATGIIGDSYFSITLILILLLNGTSNLKNCKEKKINVE